MDRPPFCIGLQTTLRYLFNINPVCYCTINYLIAYQLKKYFNIVSFSINPSVLKILHLSLKFENQLDNRCYNFIFNLNGVTRKMKERSEFAHWSFKHAYLSAIIAALAVLGYRFGIMNYQVALIILLGGAAMGMMAVLSGIISIFSIITSDSKVSGIFLALTGLILGLAVVAPVFLTIQAGYKVPRIHDITTDLQNPPKFTTIRTLRTAAHNPLDREVPANLAKLQQAGYPNLGSLQIDSNPNQVFEEAVALVKARGWEAVDISAKNGTIEATDTTKIMGFKDDVVIRVTEKENKTIVDIRSASRIGISDMGTNAARIKAFLDDLNSE